MSNFSEDLKRIKELMLLSEQMEQYKDKFSGEYRDTVLILVNVDKLMKRLKQDNPDFYVDPNTNLKYHKDKIVKAMDFFKKNVIEGGIPDGYHPPFITFAVDKLGVVEGRHRLAAIYNLGFVDSYIEVLESQVDMFKPFLGL
jgi:hypothetical protein